MYRDFLSFTAAAASPDICAATPETRAQSTTSPQAIYQA